MPKQLTADRWKKLAIEDAETLCGARLIREIAGSSQVLTNWKARGVPWDVTGPLILEQLSLASAAHSQFSRHGGPDMHAVLDLQGRVFKLARDYGIESKEFRALHGFLTLYVPDPDARASAPEPPIAAAKSSPSDAAPPPTNSAARRNGTRAKRKRAESAR